MNLVTSSVRQVSRLALILATFAAADAGAQVYRCTENGKTVYSDKPCASGASKRVDIQPDPDTLKHLRAGERLTVSQEVVRECYDAYRILSEDPTDTKIVGWYARIAPAGLPVLSVDAVFRNKMGGPSREYLYCPLTTELLLDKSALDKSTSCYLRRRHGARCD